MEGAGSSGSGRRPQARRATTTFGIGSLGSDLLCAIFSLLDHWGIARCSAVCTSWHDVIYNSSLMRERLFKMHTVTTNSYMEPSISKMPMKVYLEKLALEEHISALTEGSAEIHQWTGHSNGVSQSRMKRGLVATGVGDKVVRLWSAENHNLLGEYPLPKTQSLIDFDFDENKIVGLAVDQLFIWRRGGKRSLCHLNRGASSHSLCLRYIDPEAVIGCEDGRVRIVDMYSGSCTRIIR